MPSLVIITEAEIWPNFLHVLQRKNIPVIWINGKISSKSFKRYQYIKGFIRRILSSVSLFSVATEDTRQRMIELGIDSRRVVVNGHTKVDQALQTTVGARHAVPLPKSRRIILAASTHAGEEEVICDIFKKISNVGAPLAAPLLILAPRHPERFESVAKLLKKMDLGFRRWSRLNETPLTENEGVLLLDQIGFLAQLYSLADVAFIGGSLIPAGGHNMWEGVVQGVPMVYGPYMNQDYRLAERGGAIRVTNPLELEQQLEMLLNSTEQRDRMKLCMKKFLEEHRGAVEKNLQLVETIYH